MRTAILASILVAACGSGAGDDAADGDGGVDDGDGGATIDAPPANNTGFPRPTAVTRANNFAAGAWVEVGDADWTCLGTPPADFASANAIRLAGRVKDLTAASTGVGRASMVAFPGVMTGLEMGTAVTDDVGPTTRGDYTMGLSVLPPGSTRFGFKLEAAAYLRTFVLNQYLPAERTVQSRDFWMLSTAGAMAWATRVGATFDPSSASVTGVFRDCVGRTVSNAVATISATRGAVEHLPGATTYYFSADALSAPVDHAASPVMNKTGEFVILGAAPRATLGYVQLWGFRTPAELAAGTLTLLGEMPTPVEGGALTTGVFEAKRP